MEYFIKGTCQPQGEFQSGYKKSQKHAFVFISGFYTKHRSVCASYLVIGFLCVSFKIKLIFTVYLYFVRKIP